jgi:two-component system, NarL family, response regulator NreC
VEERGPQRTVDGAPTVLLVDDHAVVRAGIRMLLEAEADVTVVAEASSAEDAVALVLDRDPDVIVTDLSMEGIRGASVVEAFVDRFPSALILVLSMVDSPADVRRALEAGAKGYMLKGAAAAELTDAISRILSGESYVQPALGVLLAGHGSQAATHADPAAALTEREREVLALLAIGHTNPEIATLLYLSPRTVESHRANIQRKLGVRSRADLVRAAAAIDESEGRSEKEPS